jgi:heat-inducible transcriptional repressor
MGKELSERKKKILHTLVDLYISTGQPVSSADIQAKCLADVSSATIRAELSALEALGYVEQPHTSAGRVPLKAAYKLYVDDIGANYNQNSLTDAETAFIRAQFSKRLGDVEEISKKAAKIVSDVTNYTTFIVDKSNSEVVIEEIKLVPLKKGKIVVIIATNRGMIADKTIDVDENIRSEYIDTATRVLNKVFTGRRVEEIDSAGIQIDGEITDEIIGFKQILDDVMDIIRAYVNEHEDNVFVEGALKMLDYPEYNNVADAKNFLSVISDKENISELLDSSEDSIEFSVKIGKEDKGVDKCAIVSVAYKVGGKVLGQAGVIGPERMDYKKVIGVLEYMKNTLSCVLDESKSLDGDDGKNKNNGR